MQNIFYKDSKLPETWEGISVSGEIRCALCEALQKQCKVRIFYEDAQGNARTREVIPVMIFCYEKIWYMSAFCFLRNEYRTFCFHRVLKAELTGETAVMDPVPETILQNGVPWNCSLTKEELPRERAKTPAQTKTSGSPEMDLWTKSLFLHVINGASPAEIREDLAKGANIRYVDREENNILSFAVQYATADVVHLLLEYGADPHQCYGEGEDEYEIPLLMDAVLCGRMEMVRLLTEECHCCVDLWDRMGEYDLLYYALEGNDTPAKASEMVRHLIKHGADPRHTYGDGSTFLMQCVSIGMPDLVQFLIEKCQCVVRDHDYDGAGILFYALHCNDAQICMKMVRYLIQHGADPNECYLERSLLSAVLERGDRDLIRYLVKEGKCRINKVDPDGENLLFHAVRYLRSEPQCLEMVRFLLELGADPRHICKGKTLLMEAVIQGKKELFRFLLKEKLCNIHKADPIGQNILFYVLYHDPDMEDVRLLLSQGICLKSCDRSGCSSLLLAVRKALYKEKEAGEPRVIQKQKLLRNVILLLLKHEPGLVNMEDHKGVTPAMIGRGRILSTLLKYGANPNAKDDQGKRVVQYHCDHLRDLILLKKYGADLYFLDEEGNNLLLLAETEFTHTRDLIRKFGFSVNSTNHYGTTILHLACKKGDLSLIEYLKKQGADPEKRDCSGRLPVNYLAEYVLEDVYKGKTSSPDQKSFWKRVLGWFRADHFPVPRKKM